ncbi:MAG: hypothetical protein OEQ18_01400 [Gammaproteobacteria bacterium]|nr:hypothetical protein [Gammaproteobacteria bacterium]
MAIRCWWRCRFTVEPALCGETLVELVREELPAHLVRATVVFLELGVDR